MPNPIPDLEFHDRSREFCDILVGADGINSPGMKNALKDAEIFFQALINYSSENYISCIKEYENEMLKRTSAEVLKGRYALKQASPVEIIL
ncbi:hypothetical protein RhiirA1_468726 [Rhizophagus irregularis]|uniref:FAD-binding domain-containing protein n=1 Tax=Rhizophagus irregularis TaxID=588596 RepID=A0A2N0R9F7_9GLOM|nr:hypothetical protein RhiirA1_468726 [Rhizophagus irregularis]